jgi:hypothetical protein
MPPWQFHTDSPTVRPGWLIKGILPETGAALISGQWGTFKTTVALDLAVSVMTGSSFAGQYRVKRQGGVLFIALEGEGMLSSRLSAIAEHRGVQGPLPFAWRGDCPALTNGDAAGVLSAAIDEAYVHFDLKFNLPIAMIVIDTIITAAQYTTDGADNDAAVAQKIFATLRALSRLTGALVIGIDHFGKAAETGTRGSSAKEGAADAILALLAEREIGGAVRNTRFAVRKQRDGSSGLELPFNAKAIEVDRDEDGDPVTAVVIDWQAGTYKAAAAPDRWTKGTQTLRRVLMTMLGDHGKSVTPFSDDLTVRACDIELVRTEFYRQQIAEGSAAEKKKTREKAFTRATSDAKARGLIASRDGPDGVHYVWLTKPELGA